MGHDYLDIGDGHLRLNDFHIKTLGHLFTHCASTVGPDALGTDADTLPDLQQFFSNWQCVGPGIFTGTDFNTFATSPSRYSVLRALFACVLDYVMTFGDKIPLDYLERHVNTPGMSFTVPQPTSLYRDAIRIGIRSISDRSHT